jgi:hypothetical protein
VRLVADAFAGTQVTSVTAGSGATGGGSPSAGSATSTTLAAGDLNALLLR